MRLVYYNVWTMRNGGTSAGPHAIRMATPASREPAKIGSIAARRSKLNGGLFRFYPNRNDERSDGPTVPALSFNIKISDANFQFARPKKELGATIRQSIKKHARELRAPFLNEPLVVSLPSLSCDLGENS